MIKTNTGGLSLDISNLEVSFPGLQAPALVVDNLELAAGKHLAVTGASGSGKSTLVNIITGMEALNKGRIRWNNTELNSLSSIKRDAFRAENIGLVMQDFHLFPGLSALANILLPVKLRRRVTKAETEYAYELLNAVGFKRAHQKIETLSRGEMQRVAVARALLSRPGAIIADEPTASLDQKTGIEVSQLLLRLASEQGATLIVVTHDPLMMQMLDRRIILEAGRIIADSTKGTEI